MNKSFLVGMALISLATGAVARAEDASIENHGAMVVAGGTGVDSSLGGKGGFELDVPVTPRSVGQVAIRGELGQVGSTMIGSVSLGVRPEKNERGALGSFGVDCSGV